MSEIRTARLTGQDIKTLALAALGGALEFYDFIIFAFFTAVISKVFFPAGTADWLALVQTWGLFAVAYFARPLGGIVMAHFGDRDGRKRVFTLSVLLMAVPTFLISTLPTYAEVGYWAPLALLGLRVLQGAAVGGEVPGAWTFVAEHVPRARVGFACGVLTAGLTVGILLGSLTATAINKSYTPAEVLDFGWRIPFRLGGLFGLLAVFLRFLLSETPVFEALRQRDALVRGLPLTRVLAGHRRAVVVSMLLTWVLTAAIVVVILMTPGLIQKLYAIAPADALAANSLATLGLIAGCVVFGMAADRFGPARVLTVGCIALLLAVYALYLGVRQAPGSLNVVYLLAGCCVGVTGVVPTVLVGAFPAEVRFTGISFAYNVAYAIFGGLTPIFLGAVITWQPLAPAHYVAALCIVGIITATYVGRHRARDVGAVTTP